VLVSVHPLQSASAAAERHAHATPARADRNVAAQMSKSSDAYEAVAEALTRLRKDLERMSRRRFPSLDADEVYQRAAVRALERYGSVRELDRVDGWVRRISVTCAFTMLRERQRERLTPAQEHEVEASRSDDETCTCALALMQSLPKSYADMIRHVDLEGIGLAEVAGNLHIAKNNATLRLHRARNALRTRLRKHCGVKTMRECLSCTCNEGERQPACQG
jgi:DNA-directed RNA polymerase specialized sigma24 family protein